MKIILIVLGVLLILMGLLLAIVQPIVGIIGVVLGVVVILYGRKLKREREAPSMTLEELVKKYPPHETVASRNAVERHGEKQRVAGTSYRQKEIASLGELNDDFMLSKRELIDNGFEDEKIFEKVFFPSDVRLVLEQENIKYAGAVRVEIDGVLVGYIKSGSASHVRQLMGDGQIKKVTAEITGGKYKELVSEYNDETDEETYTVECGETDYYVAVYIETDG